MSCDLRSEGVPDDVIAALDESAAAQSAFAKMPPSHRRRWVEHVTEPKKPETRAARIAKMVQQIEAENNNLRRPLLQRGEN